MSITLAVGREDVVFSGYAIRDKRDGRWFTKGKDWGDTPAIYWRKPNMSWAIRYNRRKDDFEAIRVRVACFVESVE